jgi:hypothetical protein
MPSHRRNENTAIGMKMASFSSHFIIETRDALNFVKIMKKRFLSCVGTCGCVTLRALEPA